MAAREILLRVPVRREAIERYAVFITQDETDALFDTGNCVVAYESSHVTQEAIPVGCRDFLLLIRDAEDLDWAGELLSAELPVISRYVSLNYYYFHVIS